jgi:hypothetical protein
VFIGHRLFTLLDPNTDSFLHFTTEFFFVVWVFTGLFTHYWYMFAIIILTGQAFVFLERAAKPDYYKKLLRISCLLDILILTILTLIR